MKCKLKLKLKLDLLDTALSERNMRPGIEAA